MTRRTGAALAAALLWSGLAGHAGAQGFPRFVPHAAPPCVLDRCVGGNADGPGAAPAAQGAGPVAPAPFDFYVLALSWSPGFCDTAGAAKGGSQCAPGAGLGFVVHGLWPQNVHGFPSNCGAGASGPGRMALAAARGLYPSVGLAIHEWRMHGTCTGLSPTDYLAAVRRARDAVTIPPALQQPSEPQTVAPLDLARAFAASNPGLRTDTMAVTCRDGELEEVRLCFTKDLRGFTPCQEVARGTCRSPSISVLPTQ